MKRLARFTSQSAFTLIELMIGGAVTSAIGLAVFAFLNAGMLLTAKNLSLNLTSNQMRGTLDRVEQILQQGDTDPVLIDTAGATVTSGPAAGVKLDRYVGGPYVVTTTATGLAAGITSVTITRSTHSMASPSLPLPGDVIRFDSTASTVRPRVLSASAGNPDGSLRQAVNVTLAAPLSTAVSVASPSVLTAKLVHPVAFIVMPNGSKNELRFYGSIETTTNLADQTKYIVVTDQIATQAEDTTPFSLSTISGETFVNFALRVRDDRNANRLRTKQADEYNTFSRVNSYLRPKINP